MKCFPQVALMSLKLIFILIAYCSTPLYASENTSDINMTHYITRHGEVDTSTCKDDNCELSHCGLSYANALVDLFSTIPSAKFLHYRSDEATQTVLTSAPTWAKYPKHGLNKRSTSVQSSDVESHLFENVGAIPNATYLWSMRRKKMTTMVTLHFTRTC